jgi:hypothetical protein
MGGVGPEEKARFWIKLETR